VLVEPVDELVLVELVELVDEPVELVELLSAAATAAGMISTMSRMPMAQSLCGFVFMVSPGVRYRGRMPLGPARAGRYRVVRPGPCRPRVWRRRRSLVAACSTIPARGLLYSEHGRGDYLEDNGDN